VRLAGGYKKAIATAPATMTPVTLPRITALCRVEAPSGSKLQVPTCGSNERADGRWGGCVAGLPSDRLCGRSIA